jgi:hypothetical protein
MPTFGAMICQRSKVEESKESLAWMGEQPPLLDTDFIGQFQVIHRIDKAAICR